MDSAGYDPFAAGRDPVGVRTFRAQDAARGRVFPCEIWYPAQAESTVAGEARDAKARRSPLPLVVFSHYSGGHRRKAVFLGRHLASHGYAVAALDHSEVIAPELARPSGETSAGQAERIAAVIGSRVPDVRFLLDHLLTDGVAGLEFDAGTGGAGGAQFRRLDRAGRAGGRAEGEGRGGARAGRRGAAQAGNPPAHAGLRLGSRSARALPGRRG
jgi:hypothetical protein